MVLEFPYIHEGKGVYKPKILVRFSRLSNSLGQETHALIDSGADISYLPTYMADYLGIPYRRFQLKSVTTLAGLRKVYHSKVDIHLPADNEEKFSIPVQIPSDNNERDIPILGRKGFFERFKITFDEREKRVVLEEY